MINYTQPRTQALMRSAFLLLGMLASRPALGQSPDLSAAIRAAWTAALRESAGKAGVAFQDARLVGSEDRRTAAYREAIERVTNDQSLVAMALADNRVLQQTVRDTDRQYIRDLQTSQAETKSTTSVDARSTNPSAGGLTERSGFSELIALGLSGQNLVSSDKTAVSLNLSALALVSLADPDVYSELYRYQQHSFARRVGGTIVFGAKVPEKDITEVSGVPDFATLLDVFVWDLKVRVLGDRDPRSARWFHQTLGSLGLGNEVNAIVITLVPPADVPLVLNLLNEHLGRQVTAFKQTIGRAPQLTAKVSGTHLTKEKGRNKYTAGALFDMGVGDGEVTANVLYSQVDDIRFGEGQLFQITQWTVSGSLTSHFAKNAIVRNRAADVSAGVVVHVFSDRKALPIAIENTWKVFSTLDIPLGDTARIPFSVVYTNDPNALEKSKYISGQIGISYDFSALSRLFKDD